MEQGELQNALNALSAQLEQMKKNEVCVWEGERESLAFLTRAFFIRCRPKTTMETLCVSITHAGTYE